MQEEEKNPSISNPHWEHAANAMWNSTGQPGYYTYGGKNPTAIIYA